MGRRRLEKQERSCRGSYTHRTDGKVNEGSGGLYGSRKRGKEGSDSLVRLKRGKGKQDLGLEGMDNSTLFQHVSFG